MMAYNIYVTNFTYLLMLFLLHLKDRLLNLLRIEDLVSLALREVLIAVLTEILIAALMVQEMNLMK